MRRAIRALSCLTPLVVSACGTDGTAARDRAPLDGPGALFLGVRLAPPFNARAWQGYKVDPVNGQVAYRSPFYADKDSITVRLEKNAEILAAAAGRVVVLDSQPAPARGYLFEIAHGDRLRTRYAGVFKPTVREGERVESRQKIGSTDGGTLEFTVLVRADLVDEGPTDWARDRAARGPRWVDVPAAELLGTGGASHAPSR